MEIKNFENAKKALGNRNTKKIANNTFLVKQADNEISVCLYHIGIIRYRENGQITLTSGGYRTSTTKDRLNQFSPFFILQRYGLWIVKTGLKETVFFDGIIFQNGECLNLISSGLNHEISEMKRIKKLKKMISAYCQEIKTMEKLPYPDNGDCFYCNMYDQKTGKPLGEVTNDTDHLVSHLEEKYVNGSLIFNALKKHGSPEIMYQLNVRDLIASRVRNYFKKHLGIGR